MTDRVPAWGLAVAAILTIQLGAALSTRLFDDVGPGGTAWLRLTAGGVIFLAIVRPRLRSFSRRDLGVAILLGIVTGVMTVAFLFALDRIPLGTLVAIEFLGPLGVAVFRSHSRSSLLWPALALTGVLLLTEPWHGEVDLVGVLLALVAAAGWATYILLTQAVGDRFSGIQALAVTIPVAAIASSVVGIPQAWGNITGAVILQAIGLAILLPVIPFALELVALRRLTAAAFGTLMALEPAFATMWGAVLLSQVPGLWQVAGMVLVVVRWHRRGTRGTTSAAAADRGPRLRRGSSARPSIDGRPRVRWSCHGREPTMTSAIGEMSTRPLGARSGIDVTDVGLGLWAVAGSEWGPVEDQGSLDAIEVALDAGITFFDTADVYGAGHSEELLGQAMAGRRDRFIVASKIGWIDFDRDADHSQYDSVDRLVAGVEGSLRRLQTDVLDVIQCHIDYREPNTDVFIEGFRLLKQQGKVRAWGVSTSRMDLLQYFNADGDCDVLQTDYSILNRTAEAEILPYCEANGIGVIVRGPIAMGLLAGKFGPDQAFADDDFRKAWIEDPEQNTQYLADLAVVEALRAVVPEGQTMAEFALRFVRSHTAVSTVIPGARDGRQAAANAAAGRAPLLTPAESAAVDAIVAPGGGRKIWPA